MNAHEHFDVLPKGVVRIDAGLADLALADHVAPCLLAAESFSLGDADKGGDIVRPGYRPCPIASTDQSRPNRPTAAAPNHARRTGERRHTSWALASPRSDTPAQHRGSHHTAMRPQRTCSGPSGWE